MVYGEGLVTKALKKVFDSKCTKYLGIFFPFEIGGVELTARFPTDIRYVHPFEKGPYFLGQTISTESWGSFRKGKGSGKIWVSFT